MPEGIFTFDEIKRRLQPIFTSHRVRQAILFGSYGKGPATQKAMWICWWTAICAD